MHETKENSVSCNSDKKTYINKLYSEVVKEKIFKEESWADIMEDRGISSDIEIVNIPCNNTKDVKKEDLVKTIMFEIHSQELPYLIGSKGRNISLIRKFTGIMISIENNLVHMLPVKKNANVDLCWKMVLSACYGGILRWFETPYATKKGYPEDKIDEYQAMAKKLDMSLDLLRSRRGHMCLMLTPNIVFKSKNQMILSKEEIEHYRSSIERARSSFIEVMNFRKNQQ